MKNVLTFRNHENSAINLWLSCLFKFNLFRWIYQTFKQKSMTLILNKQLNWMRVIHGGVCYIILYTSSLAVILIREIINRNCNSNSSHFTNASVANAVSYFICEVDNIIPSILNNKKELKSAKWNNLLLSIKFTIFQLLKTVERL